MKLKLDANNNAVLQDGKPVYVKDDGTEIAFDGKQAFEKITQLTGEAAGHRQAKETAEGKLKAFEGITNPAEALKAVETLKNIDQSKLIDAGKVETIKTEAINATKAQYEPVVAERDQLRTQLNNEVIGGAFARSKFISEKGAIPSDMFQAAFGSAFSIDKDGKLVAKDKTGNEIYSPTRAGERADFDEALQVLVNQYPGKDHILKGTGAAGGGAQGGGRGQGGKPTITRAQFEALPIGDRQKALSEKELVD